VDGGYVKSRHPRPERNVEILAGKVLDSQDNATRFAFARNGSADGANMARMALQRCGANENTSVAFLTDGDAGLRAIHQEVAPGAEHILDWFHIAMRFTNLQQIAKGASSLTDGGVRKHALTELEHAKWRFWNGSRKKGLIGLVHLRHWALAHCFDHIPALKKLGHALSETTRYLELHADSMPNYGKRYREGLRISTGFVESAVNEIMAKRMVKKQQMPWNRHTVQSFLDFRISRPQWHPRRRISPLAARLPRPIDPPAAAA
jgi:hypothetical protein